MSAATPLLHIDRLSVSFGGHAAVRPFDLTMARGEIVALVGESGSGKSTIALATMGLLPRQAHVQGAIRFEDQPLFGRNERDWSALRGNRISMIFQEPMTSLNPLQPIGKQVAEALTLHRPMSAQSARKQALELLELVRLPEPGRRFGHYPHQLSGGQRQRVMIAIAVACRPGLLIADEPTTALDVTIQAQILGLIDSLRRELSMAVLLITHDLGVVGRWADRVVVMKDGAKIEEAPGAQLFAQPSQPYTRALLGASLNFGAGLHYRDARLTDAPRTPPRPAAATHARVLLEARDVRVDYHGVRAVDGVSFAIRAGETVGLVGESGCGKSSLSRALTRLVEPTGGSIVFDGEDVAHRARRALRPYRRRVQMIFQDPYGSLNPRHTVERTLGHALAIHGVSNRRERHERIRRIVDAVGLPQAALRRYPHEFSGGQRQRIGIARALVLRPELVICDEPVSALDVSIQAQILDLLADLKHELGLALLFISHDLSVVRYIADRVLVMQAGRIVESGDHTSIWTAPQHDYTRALIDAVPSSSFNTRKMDRDLQEQATADFNLAAAVPR
ncbi:ABC transporter ATP-binding protein (plasmid) [Burkholderia sp. SFA1]|uniref:ABC transporter ATP-binding protein n=1 Tax=unclassified Caballeronia TaxID=2646786 RepID=UPI001F208E6F|nr:MULTISPECIES: ABC transporter ATP-binding protein [unclassified Caballeronia]MCE4545758.1 ABC transporter ATP-binding protein [Caballeronia sp. PC1]MCE4572120.1 ABC transporter ATP-binding protein [Caballeronia sp. CLC5]BBQ01108.1 ABC transporter ATP-binding protein [Burkholderia sp. SFA1]